jgi:hypothetical protein
MDLDIPEDVKQRACEVYDAELLRDVGGDHYDQVSEWDVHAEIVALMAVAPAIVAAELRRLADGFDKIAAGSIGWVIRQDAASLRSRADELDGGGAR